MSQAKPNNNSQVPTSGVTELDKESLEQIQKVFDRVGKIWQLNTFKILEEFNPILLNTLRSCESRVDSMVFILNKPQALKNSFKKYLEEYERVLLLCCEFAARHSEIKK